MVVRHKPLPVGDGSNATNASFLWQDRVSQVTGMDSNISEKEALNPLEVSFGTPMNDAQPSDQDNRPYLPNHEAVESTGVRERMPNSPRRHFKSDLTHQIFSWLLVAERPLHRSELLEALEYRARGPPISALAKSNTAVNSAQGLELDIESVCRGLVTVAKEGTVDFSTPSVRKYLLLENSSKHPRRPILEAHELVAWTCLNVIHSKNVESTSLSSSDLLPHGVLATEPLSTLSEYAFANWPFHYRMAEAYSRVLAGTLQRVLAISLNDACKTSSIPHDQRAASIASKTLQIGARYGFPELTKMCLEMGHEANGDACGCCKTALPIALTNGHTGVAEILLQKGAATEPIRYNGSPGMRLLRSAVARRFPDQIEANPERDIEESTSITHSEEISLHLIIQYAL